MTTWLTDELHDELHDELRRIVRTDDLHIAPLREDGITHGTPTWIWSVVVDDSLSVRAYHGTSSRCLGSMIGLRARSTTVKVMPSDRQHLPDSNVGLKQSGGSSTRCPPGSAQYHAAVLEFDRLWESGRSRRQPERMKQLLVVIEQFEEQNPLVVQALSFREGDRKATHESSS